MTIQVAPDDCTGCGVCVDVCPAKSKTEVRHKAINMEPALGAPRRRAAGRGTSSCRSPSSTATLLPHDSVKGSQALAAAVRVLRRLRRLRRDAVHQAASPSCSATA